METWLGVELRHLSALAAVAEEQSFRGAADRLGYVQSAVSQRIAQLETAVGTRLVERSRGHRHVSLTPAGEVLLHHAEQIRHHLDAARADLKALTDDTDTSTLTVGAFGSLATRILPQAIAVLATTVPNLRIEIEEAQSDRAHFSGVQEGRLDVGFAELPLENGSFGWQELLVDPLVFVVPHTSVLARRERPLTLADIAAEPLILDPTWHRFQLLEAEFAAAGHELDVRYTATSNAGIQALVAAGLGAAVMPALAVDHSCEATVALDAGDVLAARRLVCYWPSSRERGTALMAFLQAMDGICAPLRAAERARVEELVA